MKVGLEKVEATEMTLMRIIGVEVGIKVEVHRKEVEGGKEVMGLRGINRVMIIGRIEGLWKGRISVKLNIEGLE